MSEQRCEREKPVLVVKMDRLLNKEQQAAFAKDVERGAERLGMSALLLTGGADAHIDRDLRPLLGDLVAEQRKTNDLLTALITAMADEGAVDVEAESIITHDLSGRPLKKPGGHHG